MSNPRIYLGDSVYAEFDGFYLTLTTENGMAGSVAGDPSNTIVLEPGVYEALLLWLPKVKGGLIENE